MNARFLRWGGARVPFVAFLIASLSLITPTVAAHAAAAQVPVGEGIVPVHGLNYKDAPADAAGWLDRMGDPYRRTGADLDGRVAIDWGVYGVPETFVVDANGTIAYKQIGPITPDVWNKTLLPLIRSLRNQKASP